MKYFAIALICGLFAISQAMPVEESRERRLFGTTIINGVIQGAKSICKVVNNGQNKFLTAACNCLNLVGDLGNIIGSLGDESKIEDEKRFLFGGNLVEKAIEILNGFCSQPAPELANFCSCAPGVLNLAG